MVSRVKGRSLLASALLVVTGNVLAELPTELNRSSITEGEAVQLTIEMVDAPGGSNDLSPLEQDFKVLGRSQQSRTVINNGKYSRSKTLILTLAPKRTGQLTIPAFTLQGDQTQPQMLTVREPSKQNQAALADAVSISGSLTDKTPYVQQPLIYTLRIELAEQLFDGSIEGPELLAGEALIEPLGEQNQFQAKRGGELISVVEQQYLITPQRSGKVELGPGKLTGKLPVGRARNTVFGPQYSKFRQVNLRTEAYSLSVRSIPSRFSGDHWLPAQQLSLNDDWDMDSLEVGQPITRTLTLKATGITANQLPELKLTVPDGVRQYLSEPATQQYIENGEIVSELKQEITLIPTKSGSLEFPAIDVYWWSTRLNRTERARIESTGLLIDGENPSGNTAPVQPSTSNNSTVQPKASVDKALPPTSAKADPAPKKAVDEAPKPAADNAGLDGKVSLHPAWLAAIALLVMAAGSAGWWFGRRSRSVEQPKDELAASAPESNAKKLINAVCQACASDDLSRIRSALIKWSQQQWPGSAANLNQLIKHSDAELRDALIELNRMLYADAATSKHWQGAQLWSLFSRFTKTLEKSEKSTDSSLKPLNPVA